MAREFNENESRLPKEHWFCQKCSAKSNLIRPYDVSRQTFCKPCLIELKESLTHALHEKGIKFMLTSIIDSIDQEKTFTRKKYIVDHIKYVLEDRLQDWEQEEVDALI